MSKTKPNPTQPMLNWQMCTQPNPTQSHPTQPMGGPIPLLTLLHPATEPDRSVSVLSRGRCYLGARGDSCPLVFADSIIIIIINRHFYCADWTKSSRALRMSLNISYTPRLKTIGIIKKELLQELKFRRTCVYSPQSMVTQNNSVSFLALLPK